MLSQNRIINASTVLVLIHFLLLLCDMKTIYRASATGTALCSSPNPKSTWKEMLM